MSEYIDNVLIKLRRKYGKDEYVKVLINRLKEVETELGVVKSERDEALYKIDKLSKIPQEVKSRAGQMTIVKNLKTEVRVLREKNKKLEKDYSRLMEKTAKLQI